MPALGAAQVGRGVKGAGGFLHTGQGVIDRWKRINITATPTGSEQDTGWDLPSNGIVRAVYIYVATAEATGGTKTLDVGLLSSESGGDADGFLDGVSVSSTGWKGGDFTYTDGGSQNYVSAATFGLLLYSGLLGADGAGTAGTVAPKPHLIGSVTAKSITYTAGSNDFAEFRGALLIQYSEFL